MSLRGVERRSNLGFGRLEIASGFALAMTILESFRVIKTDITLEKPYIFRLLTVYFDLYGFAFFTGNSILGTGWGDSFAADDAEPPHHFAQESPQLGNLINLVANAY
ncbi:MAG TPA: hypothetical protein VK463_06615 [Desulfomonilaceae bacterium]|nr:hypothetical protein [Desulfomonilaceae bacterium]